MGANSDMKDNIMSGEHTTECHIDIGFNEIINEVTDPHPLPAGDLAMLANWCAEAMLRRWASQ